MHLEFHLHFGTWFLAPCLRNSNYSFFFFLAFSLASFAFRFSGDAGSSVALNKKSLVPQKRLEINEANMGLLPGITDEYLTLI